MSNNFQINDYQYSIILTSVHFKSEDLLNQYLSNNDLSIETDLLNQVSLGFDTMFCLTNLDKNNVRLTKEQLRFIRDAVDESCKLLSDGVTVYKLNRLVGYPLSLALGTLYTLNNMIRDES